MYVDLFLDYPFNWAISLIYLFFFEESGQIEGRVFIACCKIFGFYSK